MLQPVFVFLADFAQSIGRISSLRDPFHGIHTHDRRCKDKSALLDPLMTECPADQQISWPQCLVHPWIHTWHYRPIFELYGWLLGWHAFFASADGMQSARVTMYHRKFEDYMPKFIIERNMPGAGALDRRELAPGLPIQAVVWLVWVAD